MESQLSNFVLDSQRTFKHAVLMRLFLQTLTVLILLMAAVTAIVLVADAGSDASCVQKIDWALPGCLLRSQKELAGSLLGAAGTILAGWIAWVGVQKQVRTQVKTNLIAEMTFWQSKYDEAESALGGIQTLRLATKDFKEICERNLSPSEKLDLLSGLGALELSNFVSTGPEHTAWKIAILTGRMRGMISRMRVFRAHSPKGDFPMDGEAQQILDEMIRTLKDLPALAEKRAIERTHAEQALKTLRE